MEPSRRSGRKRKTPARFEEQMSDTDTDVEATSPSKKVREVKQKTSKTKKKAKATTSQASKRKEKKRKVGKAKPFTSQELATLRENADERRRHVDDLVDRMSNDQCRQLLVRLATSQPGIIMDMLDVVTAEEAPAPAPAPHGDEPPEDQPGPAPPHWCRCGNCHIMQTQLEDVCCGYSPEDCLSNAPEMQALCLDQHVLNLNMLYRADIMAVRNVGQGDNRSRNKSFRHAGYRQHILWQYGRLGRGNRRVIASCCVWKIRNTFPDPSGQYIPYRPGRL